MDAKKVLHLLREIDWTARRFDAVYGIERVCPACWNSKREAHKPDCELVTLIAEAEQEAREGGWKPGSEPPEDDRLVEITTLAYYSNGQWYSENDCRVPMMYKWRRRRTPPPFPGNPDLQPLPEQSEVKP